MTSDRADANDHDILMLAAVAYLALIAFVYGTQRGQIYFPTPASEAPGVQALSVESQGERIKLGGGATRATRPPYFGGNAEDVAGNIELFAEAFPDRSLFLVNYRGYGGSTGRPSEAGLVKDALGCSIISSGGMPTSLSWGEVSEWCGGAAREPAAGIAARAGDGLRQSGERGAGHIRWLPVGADAGPVRLGGSCARGAGARAHRHRGRG